MKKIKNLDIDFIANKKSSRKSKKAKANSTSEKSLVFSKKIVAMLEDKMNAYNSEALNKKVQLKDLKKAYKAGFNTPNPKEINIQAIANVNILLRVLSGKYTNIFNSFKQNNIEIFGSEFLIKGNFNPEQADFDQAKADIEKYGLEDFDFLSVDELYLEDEEDKINTNFYFE